MSDQVLFELPDWKRRDMLARHNFYVKELQSLFLPLLSEDAIKIEADKVANETWDSTGADFNSDFHDEGNVSENASDCSYSRWELQNELRKNLLLSSTAIVFHDWEKQLRQWLTEQVSHWCQQESLKRRVWEASFVEILNLLKCMEVDVRAEEYFNKLNACRLIVNVFKHGNGASFDELKKKHPEYLRNYEGMSKADLSFLSSISWQNHTSLEITIDDLSNFSDAILNFWKSIPEEAIEADLALVPKWFRNAINDR